MLLAIDTATRALSFALHDGKTVLAEQVWLAGNQHNSLLSTAIQKAFAICGVHPDQISAVAVAQGPGSYTGLRIGIALAKGIASARNVPLVGVSTLDILALAQPIAPKQSLLAVLQAGRGRVIGARYTLKKGRWHTSESPTLGDWQTLLSSLETATLITGEIDEEGEKAIAAHSTDTLTLTIAPAYSRVRRPSLLAEEALLRLKSSSPADFAPAKLLPIYLNAL